ncbi:MAG: PQQ-like beta-propeller repeat protein [Verrucomicrobia bacterium]|nr:PQQ-like beta-propeller repeat protein [Verrucomicrobiota bacterium]
MHIVFRIVFSFGVVLVAPLGLCLQAAPLQTNSLEGWVTAGANPQRTSWVPDAAPTALDEIWVKPVEPYISQKVQIIAAEGKLFLSTARGLYAFDADTGADLWVYATELPLGHSPTYASGRVYVGGMDRKIHAIDASTGQGLWTFSAMGGFHTCPLVVGGVVYAGSRDGRMYALKAATGKLVWQFRTAGQILQSAAYQDGIVFFGSQDAHAYALDERTGAQIWRSQKLPGMGWHSWWPVIYKDAVLFTRTEVEKGLVGFQNEWLFTKKVSNSLPGVRGNEPGDWATGETTVDLRTNPNGGTICDWFERYPWRRSLIVLDRRTGREIAFDLDSDGITDAAPMLWAWTHGGTCYPPLVSGHDNVIYFRSVTHAVGTSIPGAVMVGWKYGTPFLSLPVSNMPGQSGFWPGDEPVGISAGGKFVYWNLCNDRFIGSADLSVANSAFPNNDGRRQWRHVTGDGFKTTTLPAGYNRQSSQYHWSVGPSKTRPMYWAHGDNVGPTIYNGRMYVHRGNAIVGFAPGGLGSSAPVLTVARAPSGGVGPDPILEAALRERLEAEVQKILDSGHLMAGFAKIGLVDFMTVNSLGQYLLHYWHNPADMLATLLRALPHLPAAVQDKVRRYLQDEYASFPPHKYVHIGFKDGAPREPFDYPPSTARIFEHEFGPQLGSPFRGWSKPPHNVYALWKYAQAGLADPASVFRHAVGVIGSTPSDGYLEAFPHVHNAYIAGYLGYVGLAKMAGQPYAAQEMELNRLLQLRARTFRWDVQADTGNVQSDQYFYTFITAWNFMFLVPELADYLRQNARPKVKEAIDRYTHMAPYWMVGHNEEVQHENGLTPLHQTHALFQAKAQILKASRDELTKLLDPPSVAVGDLYYIQNLTATIEAAQRETH